jgi:hypothetical protein
MKGNVPYASRLPGLADDCGPGLLRKVLACVSAPGAAGGFIWALVMLRDWRLICIAAATLAPLVFGGLSAGVVLGRYARFETRIGLAFAGMVIGGVAVSVAVLLYASPFLKWWEGAMLALIAMVLSAFPANFGAAIAHALIARTPPSSTLRRARTRRWTVK